MKYLYLLHRPLKLPLKPPPWVRNATCSENTKSDTC